MEDATQHQRDRAIAFTQPLFTKDGAGRRVLTASCLILAVGPRLAVVSASHALRRVPGREFFFGSHTRLHPLSGHSRRTLEASGSSADSDRVDVGVVILDDSVASEVDRQYAVDVAAIDLPKTLEGDPLYLAVGYPYSRQKGHRWRRDIAATAHAIMLERDNLSAYAKHGLDPLTSLVLHHDREDVFRRGRAATSPNPEGMSGGGVWRLELTESALAAGTVHLAGIFIEHWQRSQKNVVATRAWFALKLLLQLDPTLGEWINPVVGYG